MSKTVFDVDVDALRVSCIIIFEYGEQGVKRNRQVLELSRVDNTVLFAPRVKGGFKELLKKYCARD